MDLQFDENTDPNDFEEVEIIGRGGFGSVYELKYKKTGQLFAGKQINEGQLTLQAKEALKRENDVMMQMSSPCIIHFYGHIMYNNKLTLLMDFCDRGSLRDLMDYTERAFTEPQIAIIMHDLLTALSILKKKKIIHRDVKAANILATSKAEFKLTDFGVSRQFHENTLTQHTVRTIGTPYWMAPEVVDQKSKYTFPADVWSVGATAIELVDGDPPYVEYMPRDAMMIIKQKGFQGFRKDKQYSELFKNFVRSCMEMDPNIRPTPEELLDDPFVKQAEKLDRNQLFGEILKDPIDFSVLMGEGDDEEEEEEEEADENGGFMNYGLDNNNKTVIKDPISTIQAEPAIPEPTPAEAPQPESPQTPPEQQQTEPAETQQPTTVEVQQTEPTPVEVQQTESTPVEVPQQEQKQDQVQKPKIQFEVDSKATAHKSKAGRAKSRIVNSKQSKSINKKGYGTFIKPLESNVPLQNLYSNDSKSSIQTEKPVQSTTPTQQTTPIMTPKTTTEQKGIMGKIKFYGAALFVFCLAYFALDTKKFILILMLLLPILFFCRNLF